MFRGSSRPTGQSIVRKSGPGFAATRCGTTKRPEHRTTTINGPMLEPIGQLRAMTPLARNGPKLRPEVGPLARVLGDTFDLGSLVPVVLSGLERLPPRG